MPSDSQRFSVFETTLSVSLCSLSEVKDGSGEEGENEKRLHMR